MMSRADQLYAERRDRSWFAASAPSAEESIVLPILLLILGLVCWVIL